MALIDFLRYLLCERTGNDLGIWITDQSGTNSLDNLNRADVCFMDWLWLHNHPEHPYYKFQHFRMNDDRYSDTLRELTEWKAKQNSPESRP